MPNSHVGVQGENVTVHGGIHLGGPDSDSKTVALAAERGRTAIRLNRRRRALNWMREAFRGITDLAAGVATIMTAVRSVT
jgi:hypothetical protein